jgi:CRP/FNR family transcriptional regulator, nitrogen fixation regulation protein
MSFQVLQSLGSLRPTEQPSVRDAFESLARLSRLAPGEEIFAQESEATCYYRVVKGVVRSTRLSSDGRRQVGEFYFAGDMFGLAVGARHRHAAEALTACEIQVVRRAALSMAADVARVERLIWTVTSQQLEQAQERMLVLARHTAYEKVAYFLTEIARRSEGPWASLPMCRQDIADYLGLTIETVSRMLTQLQQDGLVRLDGSRRFRIAQRLATDLAA